MLLGSEVIPPVNTRASGTADFIFTEHDRSWTCDYTISIFNLSNINTVEAHQAPRASNGDLVYYLYGPIDTPSSDEVNGVLVVGSIDPSQLKGPLRGKGVKDMKDRADDGDLYVLVVTMQNPNGELRGQVEPA
ncbi:g1666 [Coccomyxa elongata]